MRRRVLAAGVRWCPEDRQSLRDAKAKKVASSRKKTPMARVIFMVRLAAIETSVYPSLNSQNLLLAEAGGFDVEQRLARIADGQLESGGLPLRCLTDWRSALS